MADESRVSVDTNQGEIIAYWGIDVLIRKPDGMLAVLWQSPPEEREAILLSRLTSKHNALRMAAEPPKMRTVRHVAEGYSVKVGNEKIEYGEEGKEVGREIVPLSVDTKPKEVDTPITLLREWVLYGFNEDLQNRSKSMLESLEER